jgi:N-acetylmuramic acid 6-phosphate etherase
MLIDAAAARATSGALTFDRDGAIGARGRVVAGLLDVLLTDPYLRQPPPKTTGRELFGAEYGARLWNEAARLGIGHHDLIATLTAFTAGSIARAYRDFLPRIPDEVFVSGGGARNPTLLVMLRQALAPARVVTSDEIGLPAEAKEAVAFAALAFESWHDRPGNLPAATGASHAVVLGDITPASPDRPGDQQTRRPADVVAESLHASSSPHLPASQASLTEARNPRTERIDALPTLEVARLINAEDSAVPAAVAAELPRIAEAIDRIAERMRAGGRLIYIGAGTSGRLGVLDASECPPTYRTAPGQVVGLIAGGRRALTNAVEGAEDDPAAGVRDIAELNVGARDSVVGIAASGETPYVLGGMAEARRRGALVISLACNRPSKLEAAADIGIAPLVGPEVVTGSTRMKAGTAQKLVLNTLSTGVMIRLGKTFGNLMVDVQPTNNKLQRRARRIVREVCGVSDDEAAALLQSSGGSVKLAIVMALAGVPVEEARQRLDSTGGVVRRAL